MIYHATSNTLVRCGRIIKLLKIRINDKEGLSETTIMHLV